MADIARRILVRASTSPLECETEHCFLFFISSLLFPAAFCLASNSKQEAQFSTHWWAVLLNLSILFISQYPYLQTFYLTPSFCQPTHFLAVNLTSLPFLRTPSLSAKCCIHMVMIIPTVLIFALLKHHSLFSPPTFLPLH